MNKKQKNKKNILQNNRNKILNRYYSSRIKSLSKFLKIIFSNYLIENIESSKTKTLNKAQILNISNKYYSILDKAVKKKVIHIKNASSKKSKCSKIIKSLLINSSLII